MKKIIFILLVSFLLTGCSYKVVKVEDEKDKQISELQSQVNELKNKDTISTSTISVQSTTIEKPVTLLPSIIGKSPVSDEIKASSTSSIDATKSNSEFELKSKCIQNKSEIEKLLVNKNYQYTLGSTKIYEKLMEVFYSPVRNSCLYSTISNVGSVEDVGTYFISYQIYDYFDNKSIFWNVWPPITRGTLTWLSQPNVAYEKLQIEIKTLKDN